MHHVSFCWVAITAGPSVCADVDEYVFVASLCISAVVKHCHTGGNRPVWLMRRQAVGCISWSIGIVYRRSPATVSSVQLISPAHVCVLSCLVWILLKVVQLLAVDTSATISMKNAAKRDINCELQNSVNHRNFERIAALGHPLATPL